MRKSKIGRLNSQICCQREICHTAVESSSPVASRAQRQADQRGVTSCNLSVSTYKALRHHSLRPGSLTAWVSLQFYFFKFQLSTVYCGLKILNGKFLEINNSCFKLYRVLRSMMKLKLCHSVLPDM